MGKVPLLIIFSSAVLIFSIALYLKSESSSCRSGNSIDRAMDVPVDQSITDIFGITSFITREKWKKVKEKVLKGEKGVIDTDGDGQPDISIFLEKDPQHLPRNLKGLFLPHYPISVKVIDNDHDIGPDGIGDTDSDTWIADWCADGTIDRIVDYYDFDSDNDVDQIAIYYSSFVHTLPGVIVSVDNGDDNKLLAVSDYQYTQDPNQWQSDYNGNESLYIQFYFDRGKRKLVPINEAPFCFYDNDGNGYSEIALRFDIPLVPSQYARLRSKMYQWFKVPFPNPSPLTGFSSKISTLRYSFDLDHDARRDNPHDYDFSISAFGEITVSDSDLQRIELRNMHTEPVVPCDRARGIAKKSSWKAASLTWDEDDSNYADSDPEKHERWEGVINSGSKYFHQVGGPPKTFNRRTEVDQDYSGKMKLYYSDIDKKIHLLGAEVGWMEIDYDYDGKMDMQMRYSDTNGNGIFDKWEIDVDGDGVYDRVYFATDERATVMDLEYSQVSPLYIAELRKSLVEEDALIRKIKEVMRVDGISPIEAYYLKELGDTDVFAQKLHTSDETKRFYLSLMLEGYFADLLRWLEERKLSMSIHDIRTLFNQGKYRELQKSLDEVEGLNSHQAA